MRTMTKNLKAVFLTLTAAFLLAACGYGSDTDDDTGLGGGGSGGGENQNDAVCQEVLDRMEDSIDWQCEDTYWFCCFCTCWNHNQVLTGEDEEYCYCDDPPSGQLELKIKGECEGDVLAWAQGVLENNTHDEEAENLIISQCNSGGGGGGGGSNECHSTGTLKCSSGILWPLLRCDDGTEKLGSDTWYECPCGCYHGASYCNSC